MKLSDAKRIGEELIEKYCEDFRLKFNNRKRTLGYCKHSTLTISLSKEFVKLNDEDKVRDILLHEIAHALSPLNEGHGRIFKSNAISIGCKNIMSNTTDKSIVSAKGRFVYTCPNCGNKVHFYRRKSRKSACGECCNKYNGGRFSKDYVLTGDYLPQRARPIRRSRNITALNLKWSVLDEN